MLPDEDEVTLVADSKLVDASLLEHELHFISLVPRTFGALAQAVERWVAESDEVRELGRTPGRKTSDPDTLYRGRPYELPFLVRRPGSEEAEPIMLRLVAIHSGALAATFEASLPGQAGQGTRRVRRGVAAREQEAVLPQGGRRQSARPAAREGHHAHPGGAGGGLRGPGEAPTGPPPGRRSAAPLPAQVPPRLRCLCPRRAGLRTAPPQQEPPRAPHRPPRPEHPQRRRHPRRTPPTSTSSREARALDGSRGSRKSPPSSSRSPSASQPSAWSSSSPGWSETTCSSPFAASSPASRPPCHTTTASGRRPSPPHRSCGSCSPIGSSSCSPPRGAERFTDGRASPRHSHGGWTCSGSKKKLGPSKRAERGVDSSNVVAELGLDSAVASQHVPPLGGFDGCSGAPRPITSSSTRARCHPRAGPR